jgi:hypothetical protein
MDLNKEKSIIYIFDYYELIEIYKDNNERLKPGYIYSDESYTKRIADVIFRMINNEIENY